MFAHLSALVGCLRCHRAAIEKELILFVFRTTCLFKLETSVLVMFQYPWFLERGNSSIFTIETAWPGFFQQHCETLPAEIGSLTSSPAPETFGWPSAKKCCQPVKRRDPTGKKDSNFVWFYDLIMFGFMLNFTIPIRFLEFLKDFQPHTHTHLESIF